MPENRTSYVYMKSSNILWMMISRIKNVYKSFKMSKLLKFVLVASARIEQPIIVIDAIYNMYICFNNLNTEI